MGEGRAAVLGEGERAFLESRRVAHLATADAAGVPHVVPVCFALRGDSVYIAIDRKPKSGKPLKRLRNIAENPRVRLTADHYDDEDWTRLRWVMVRGRAALLEEGAEHAAAQQAPPRQARAIPRDGSGAASRDRDQDRAGHELERGRRRRRAAMTARSARPRALSLFALPGIPMVQPGDDLPALIADGFVRAGEAAAEGDILVVAQKIVSKSEGRYADLATVEPGAEARELAARTAKDPRMVELILSESRRVVRHRPGVIIVEHRLGFVMANAGIDNSNVEPAGADERVLLLPRDPDGSARRLREGLRERLGVDCAVIVNDSVGRAWRIGTVGIALGATGLPSLLDLRGRDDLFGRPLEVTQVGLADELAAAASLLQGEADEGMPVVVVRGLAAAGPGNAGAALIRDEADDLFR